MVRSIGIVIAVIALIGFLIYWLFNWGAGRKEVGAELHTPLNRKRGMPDEELETRRLDLGLATGLVLLIIVGISLPLYWLGEPGRQEGRLNNDDANAVASGRRIFEASCANCHGTVSGAGGERAHTLFDNNNQPIASVKWKVPSLSSVLYRFSEAEVRYVLDYGRPNTPMAAWGTPGGGSLTTQEVENVLAYLAQEQSLPEELKSRVRVGVISTARQFALKADPSLINDRNALEAATTALVDRAATDQVFYGELLFNNIGDSGVYGCARCHTPGWSYSANEYVETSKGLVGPEIPGGGAFGPSLRNGATLRQFDDALEQQNFIGTGSQNAVRYGNFGQGDGGGQMPSFGKCAGDRDAGDRDRIKRQQFCIIHNTGTLTLDQLAAIVAYERSNILNPN